jgi:hypothetical protein
MLVLDLGHLTVSRVDEVYYDCDEEDKFDSYDILLSDLQVLYALYV